MELKEGENENEGELTGTHKVNDATSIRAGNGDSDKDSQKSEKSAIATLDGDTAETGAKTRKRRRSEMAPSRQNSSSAVATSTIFTSASNKHYKAVPTPRSLSDYISIWPKPYIPPGIGVKAGDDI